MMQWLEFREPVSAWSHGLWMLLAVPGTWLLWRSSRGQLFKQVSLLIFGSSLLYCYGASLLFHAVQIPQLIPLFWKLDHVGIYLLIAGSYTPPAAVILRGGWRWGVLSMIWLLAFGGIGMRLFANEITPFLSTSYYLVMGWSAILMYFELARILSTRALRPVVWGGVLYSVGALINLANWPNLNPSTFRAHDLFHLFVMAGSLTHFWFMYSIVVPYPFRRGIIGDGAHLPQVAPVEATCRAA